jgi:predicted nucleotidyltransferase
MWTRSILELSCSRAVEERLKPLRVGDVAVWCLDVNDLVVSKLNAGRLKDYEFVNAVLRTRLADFDVVVKRIEGFADSHQRSVLLARLRMSSEGLP